jgi:hypothetical protein
MYFNIHEMFFFLEYFGGRSKNNQINFYSIPSLFVEKIFFFYCLQSICRACDFYDALKVVFEHAKSHPKLKFDPLMVPVKN